MSKINDEEQKRLIILLQSQVCYLLTSRLSRRPESDFDWAKTTLQIIAQVSNHFGVFISL